MVCPHFMARGKTIMTDRIRILIIEDVLAVQALLATVLRGDGYWVAAASSAAEANEQLAKGDFALVLLDIQLPDGNGLTLARRLRQGERRPGIIIVSSAGLPEQRAEGLEVGADDYIAKPVFPRELLARVRNVLERRRPSPPPVERGFGAWRMDKSNRQLLTRDGVAVPLTPAEFSLLAILYDRPARVLSRETLSHLLGSEHPDTDPRSIDTLISRIRRKLGRGRSEVIETCRGAGYRFVAE